MDPLYDIAIVGCGPAGISAALNAKIRNKKILFLGTEFCSIKMHKTPFVLNYLGFPKIKGEDLRQKFLKHAEEIGIVLTNEKAESVYPINNEFHVRCGEKTYRSRAVILATGINYGKTVKGEAEYLGKGVSYCATCDAPFYEGKRVALIAYTAEAEAEGNFLSEICEKVYYIPLYKNVGFLNERIQIIRGNPVEIAGEQTVKKLILDTTTLEVSGVFIIKETLPPQQLVPGLEMDGPHIRVNRNMMTNIQGLYAAGDCAGKPYQLSKAVGEGQIAALHAVEYIDKMTASEKMPVFSK